jgi:hypothetical protein
MNFKSHFTNAGTRKQRWAGLYGYCNNTWYAVLHHRYGIKNDTIEVGSQEEAIAILERADANYKPRKTRRWY